MSDDLLRAEGIDPEDLTRVARHIASTPEAEAVVDHVKRLVGEKATLLGVLRDEFDWLGDCADSEKDDATHPASLWGFSDRLAAIVRALEWVEPK